MNQSQRMTAIYRKHEQEKCTAYEQQVRETPLVFAASGGMGKAAIYHLLQVASRTSFTEATPALQHHYGMALHSPELRPPAIGSPVPSGQSSQTITTRLE